MQSGGKNLEYLDKENKVIDFGAFRSRKELENAGFSIHQSAPGKVRLLLRLRNAPPIRLPHK